MRVEVRDPLEHGEQVGAGAVVGEDRGRQLGGDAQVAVAGAQEAGSRDGRVVDVLRVSGAVTIPVEPRLRPHGREELHRADSPVPRAVAVEPTTVGVRDGWQATARERRAEDARSDTVSVERLTAGRTRLDLSDGGEQLRAQPTGRRGSAGRPQVGVHECQLRGPSRWRAEHRLRRRRPRQRVEDRDVGAVGISRAGETAPWAEVVERRESCADIEHDRRRTRDRREHLRPLREELGASSQGGHGPGGQDDW